MCKSYCVSCKTKTNSINPRKIRSKNGRLLEQSICQICGKNKSKFIKDTQSGGALARRKGPSTTDNRKGRGVDIQKHLSKLGELHMRTPTGKKYNYCGPGTKLEERLASNDPKYRDPINNLDSICQKHDIDYSNAKSLADKHKADDLMLKRISEIPFKNRPWGTSGVQALIASKRKIGMGMKKKKSKNGKRR